MEFIDYYKELEVSRDASAEEIAKAYRRLARRYHPDVCKEPDAEERFKRINEAHQVLGDPEKRGRYDRLGADWEHGRPFEPPPGWDAGPDGARVEYRSWPGGNGEAHWSDFFEAFFGGRRSPRAAATGPGRTAAAAGAGPEPLGTDVEELLGGVFGGAPRGRSRGRPRPRRGADARARIEIGFEDAFRGGTRTLQLTDESGRTRTYDIRIPAGIRDGRRIRLAGQGGSGGTGGEAGDLYLTVAVTPDPRFRVEGDDLVTVVPVTPWDAALGGTLRIAAPDGPVEFKLPPGRSSGDRLRLRGKGLPAAEGARGDLFAEVRICVPDKLTDRERELFEELREVSSFRPSGR
jgi:curved DNA-binding protein